MRVAIVAIRAEAEWAVNSSFAFSSGTANYEIIVTLISAVVSFEYDFFLHTIE
jgi:hypothetical protein